MEIGSLLKDIRDRKGMSLRELADLSGLSASFIGQVERAETSPSMRSVMNLAQALGIKLSDLFSNLEDNQQNASPVVTPDTRRRIENVFPGVEMYLLSHNNELNMQPLLVMAKPCGSSGDGHFTHVGEEFALVLAGSLWIQIGEEEYNLRSGDSISFKSNQPHRWENKGKSLSICLWVLTPPSW